MPWQCAMCILTVASTYIYIGYRILRTTQLSTFRRPRGKKIRSDIFLPSSALFWSLSSPSLSHRHAYFKFIGRIEFKIFVVCSFIFLFIRFQTLILLSAINYKHMFMLIQFICCSTEQCSFFFCFSMKGTNKKKKTNKILKLCCRLCLLFLKLMQTDIDSKDVRSVNIQF